MFIIYWYAMITAHLNYIINVHKNNHNFFVSCWIELSLNPNMGIKHVRFTKIGWCNLKIYLLGGEIWPCAVWSACSCKNLVLLTKTSGQRNSGHIDTMSTLFTIDEVCLCERIIFARTGDNLILAPIMLFENYAEYEGYMSCSPPSGRRAILIEVHFGDAEKWHMLLPRELPEEVVSALITLQIETHRLREDVTAFENLVSEMNITLPITSAQLYYPACCQHPGIFGSSPGLRTWRMRQFLDRMEPFNTSV